MWSTFQAYLSKGKLLALPATIRPGWSALPGTCTLAYMAYLPLTKKVVEQQSMFKIKSSLMKKTIWLKLFPWQIFPGYSNSNARDYPSGAPFQLTSPRESSWPCPLPLDQAREPCQGHALLLIWPICH